MSNNLDGFGRMRVGVLKNELLGLYVLRWICAAAAVLGVDGILTVSGKILCHQHPFGDGQ